jgi:lipoprotein NlpD
VTRRRGDERPDAYVVQRGDTLYAIALDFGFDYRELAAWNELADPSRILVGQRLRFTPPQKDVAAEVKSLPAMAVVAAEPLGQPVPPETAKADDGTPMVKVPVLSEPRATTVPYTDQALAKASPTLAPATAKPAQAPMPTVASPAAVPSAPDRQAAEDDEALEWAWPVRGELLYRFGETGRLKGIGIGGRMGQPVSAAATGKVVYSGTGLRGYGRLVIVKHNETYLSVYAHNSALAVKEGDVVKRGQRIADMGDTDASRVSLHFEVRRFGRPIDPLGRLPSP